MKNTTYCRTSWYVIPTFMRLMKSWRVKETEHVACMRMNSNAYSIFVEKFNIQVHMGG
jgi:hypothetical protein